MTKEEILKRLREAEWIYGMMWGARSIRKADGTREPCEIVSMLMRYITVSDDCLYFEAGMPVDVFAYKFSDYGLTWAFTYDEIKPVTEEELQGGGA